jgi:hypothetical protein
MIVIDWNLVATLIVGILGADVVKIVFIKINNYFKN